ncbi:MAG: hypothetical protein ACJZ8Y_09425 [Pirellulaceae bacterium]
MARLQNRHVAENTRENPRHHHKLQLSFGGPRAILRGVDIAACI